MLEVLTPTRQTAAGPESANPDGISIVYFGNDWAAENRTSSHHIARLLSERFPLLYVDSPGLRAPAPTARDLRKIWSKLRQAFQLPRRLHSGMWVMTMPQIPFRRIPLMRFVNQLHNCWAVRRAIRKLRFQRPILWFTLPHPGVLAGRLGERLVVYYCIDNYAGLPDVDSCEVARLDEHLTRAADLVFASATSLVEAKKGLNRAIRYSPHGVDFSHFQKAADSTLPVAESARNLRHPIIGMFGSIRSWIDTNLIEYLARLHPEWTILLIGLATTDISSLRACPNVVLAGARPYEELPDWARAFDVAILPFRLNDGTLHANPLKLREYLATGKPVVAVSTPEIDRYANVVRIGRSREEFACQIEDALANDTEEAKRARMAAVEDTTWEARVEEIWTAVQDTWRQKRNISA